MDFLYRGYLKKLNVNTIQSTDGIHILNSNELKLIQKEYFIALYQAALLAFCGVLFYYFPIYFLSTFSETIKVTILGKMIPFPIYDVLLCLILTVLEIYLLTLVHLKMTHNIAAISGFVTTENKEDLLEKISKMATTKTNKEIVKFGLDPFQGTNKLILFLMNLLIKLKGFLANKILRYLIKRFAGRYAVKYVLDFVAAPLYMALNMYATYLVYKNTKAEIFGNQLISKYISNLPKITLNENEKTLIYHTLQLITMSKRDFHNNHSILTKNIISFFEIPIKESHFFKDEFYHELKIASPDLKKICQEIFILGLILDGHISNIEKKRIKQLQEKQVVDQSIDAISMAAKQFITGKELTII